MKAFLRRISYLSAANVVNGVLGIVFVPVAVRRLGQEGYGVFSIYAVVVAYVVLVELGLGKNLIRLLAGELSEERRLRELRLGLGLYVSVSLTLLVLAPGLAWALPRFVFPVEPAFRAAVGWIAVLGVLDYVAGVPVSLTQNHCIAQERFDRYSRFVLLSGLLRYSLSFAAVLVLRDPALVVAVIVSRRAGDVLLARFVMGGLPAGAWRPAFDLRAFRRMVGHSAALSAAQLLQITVVSAGSILVNATFGLQALGVYRAVFDLTSKVWFFSNVVGFVVFPRFVRLLSTGDGRGRLQRLLPGVLRTSWLAYGLLTAAGIAVGHWLLPRIGLAGADYAGLFATILVGVSYNAHANLSYEFLQAAGRYRAVILLAGASLILMAAGFAALASAAGVLAIGWAWLGSQVLYGTLADAAAYGSQGVRPAVPLREYAVRACSTLGLLALVWATVGSAGTAAVAAGVAALAAAVALAAADASRLLGELRLA